jgi:probable HAF family extracellular repeat protein
LFLGLAVGVAQATSFVDLSALNGNLQAYPSGINNSGQVLLQGGGGSYPSSDVTTFLYTGGSLYNIDSKLLAASGASIDRNTAMNASGQIAAGTGASSQSHILYSGGTNGTGIQLPIGSGASYQFAYGIDNAGEVSGAGEYAPNGAQWGGTVYTGGKEYWLATPNFSINGTPQASVAETLAQCMSPNGLYAGAQAGYTWNNPTPTLFMPAAGMWTAATGGWANGSTYTDIAGPIATAMGNPGSYESSLALSVNNSGQVLCTIGGFIGTGCNAALYNATGVNAGTATLLPSSFFIGETPACQSSPYLDSQTYDAGRQQMINDNGVVVGYEVVGGVDHAAIWNNGTVTDLNTLCASVLPTGWVLNDAMAIDDNGDVAGFGTDPSNNATQAFVIYGAVPTPEPSTLVLAAGGLLGMLVYAWRKRK